MKPEQFIREQGLDKAREVVEGIPSKEAEKDKGGGSTISKGTSALSRLVPYSVVYIQTNAPYATAIEFGQYPNPVKKGSYDKKAKKYVIKSVGGFSQQAPHGVYSTTFNYIAQKYGG